MPLTSASNPSSVGIVDCKKRSILIQRIPAPDFRRSGLTNENIAHLKVDEYLVREVIDCFRSEDEEDIMVALRFAECLGSWSSFRQSVGLSLLQLSRLIWDVLSHKNSAVRLCAIGAFAALGNYYPDFREVMLSLLRSADLQIQTDALSRGHTFLDGSHIRNLQVFRDDITVCQTSSADGDWRYVLRDLALETAERIVGRSFECGTKSEMREGKLVSWRCWKSFDHWLERLRWRLTEQ